MREDLASLVYALCFLTSTACAYLLGRSFVRTRVRLLLWSCICFAFLAVNNLLLVLDLTVLTKVDLQIARLLVALLALASLLFGFIWDSQEG